MAIQCGGTKQGLAATVLSIIGIIYNAFAMFYSVIHSVFSTVMNAVTTKDYGAFTFAIWVHALLGLLLIIFCSIPTCCMNHKQGHKVGAILQFVALFIGAIGMIIAASNLSTINECYVEGYTTSTLTSYANAMVGIPAGCSEGDMLMRASYNSYLTTALIQFFLALPTGILYFLSHRAWVEEQPVAAPANQVVYMTPVVQTA
jgi:glucan phosphoethanolaminetransferase (alkaline phosphatase superfamily)